jgi:4-hydroxy-tetrahydrodipicolinate synthase
MSARPTQSERPLNYPSLQGALPALVTAFTADGDSIDEDAARRHLDYLVTSGVSGVVTGGGTGEFTALTGDERRRITEITVGQIAGRVPVFAQTGATSTREAIELSEHARTAGADGIMLGLPYYEPLSDDQVVEYFGAVTTAVELPVMIYHYPYANGVQLTPELLRRLLDAWPAVRYVKDSGSDLGFTSMVRENFGERLQVFSGIESLSGPALLLGARGVVNAAANVFPAEFARLAASALAGDTAAVAAEWLRLMPFIRVMETNPFVSAVKYACRLVGYDVGPVRAPLEPLSSKARARVEQAVAMVRS